MKLGVCCQEVNFLSTNSQLLVDKKLGVCNILIISNEFPCVKRVFVCIYYSLLHESDLPEITLLVVDKNKQCNHSLHCLFWIITPLVFRCYSISIFSSCSLSVFSKRPVHRHFSWKIPETTIRREVSAVTSMNRGFREAWKNGKSFLRKNSGCRVIVHNRYRNESNGQVMLS